MLLVRYQVRVLVRELYELVTTRGVHCTDQSKPTPTKPSVTGTNEGNGHHSGRRILVPVTAEHRIGRKAVECELYRYKYNFKPKIPYNISFQSHLTL